MARSNWSRADDGTTRRADDLLTVADGSRSLTDRGFGLTVSPRDDPSGHPPAAVDVRRPAWVGLQVAVRSLSCSQSWPVTLRAPMSPGPVLPLLVSIHSNAHEE